MTTYLSLDVLEVDPNWNEGIPTSYGRSWIRFDPGNGAVSLEDRTGVGAISNSFSWFMKDRAAIVAFKAFVAARKGAAVPFWFPTWRSDLQLYANALSTDVNLSISYIGYSKFLFANTARRFIAIRLADGTTLYRKITGANDPGNGVFETITIDSAPGVAVPAAATMLSFLLLCRLSDDRVTMKWHSVNVGEADLTFQEVPKEVPA